MGPSFVLGSFPEFLTVVYFADLGTLSVGRYTLEQAAVTSHGLLVRDGKLLICDQLNLGEATIAEAGRYGSVCAD